MNIPPPPIPKYRLTTASSKHPMAQNSALNSAKSKNVSIAVLKIFKNSEMGCPEDKDRSFDSEEEEGGVIERSRDSVAAPSDISSLSNSVKKEAVNTRSSGSSATVSNSRVGITKDEEIGARRVEFLRFELVFEAELE